MVVIAIEFLRQVVAKNFKHILDLGVVSGNGLIQKLGRVAELVDCLIELERTLKNSLVAFAITGVGKIEPGQRWVYTQGRSAPRHGIGLVRTPVRS